MAYNFPEGALFYYSSTFAAAKTVSVVTNANPAVATVTGHGYSDDDEVLFSSGWEDATDTVYQIEETDANTLNVHGLVATDTNFFAAGAGVGSMYKISDWVSIPQVLSISTTGGDPRFTTISPLAKRNSIVVPTGFNATSVTLQLGHDATNANYKLMLAISRSLTKVAFKMVLSDTIAFGYGYMTVSEFPLLNVGQANNVSCNFSFLGRPTS